MKGLKSQLLFIGCILVGLCSHAWADIPNLPYDQVLAGSITSVAQTNVYTLAGTKGDVLNFTVVATKYLTGTLGPCILLSDPTGAPVDSAGGSYNPDVDMNGYEMQMTGTYIVTINDCANTATGDYVISVQKTNDPVGSIALHYAQVASGTISSVAQTNAYTLIGTKGDTLNFTVVATKYTSGTLGPCIFLYNTTGTPVLDSAGGSYNPDVEMNGYVIPATGTYNVFIKDCADTATGNYTLSTTCLGVCPLPVPKVTTISPTNALEGSPGFTLTVNGSGFANVLSNSVVQWAGVDLPTTFVSTNQLTAAVPSGDIATAGVFPVTVFTSGHEGGTSPAVDFTVNNPVPILTSISPTSALAGGPTFILTVTGSNFVKTSEVKWKTNSLANTTYVSAAQLQATVPAADIEDPGTALVTVFNPTPGGGLSAAQTFTIIQSIPPPTFKPTGGTYYSPQLVAITDVDAGVTIYYTTNGTTPTISPTDKYSGAFIVSSTETVKAIAVATGSSQSLIASATYIIQAETPVITPPAGTYTSVETCEIKDGTPGAVIYYTTNGTAPTTSSAKYTGPITVSVSETIEAIAVAPGYADSSVATADYKILGSPSALAAPATAISTSDATLNAVVNTLGLAGSYIFEYGISRTALTDSTPATALSASTAPVNASFQLTELATKTTYYFRVKVTTTGGTSSGAVLSVMTN